MRPQIDEIDPNELCLLSHFEGRSTPPRIRTTGQTSTVMFLAAAVAAISAVRAANQF